MKGESEKGKEEEGEGRRGECTENILLLPLSEKGGVNIYYTGLSSLHLSLSLHSHYHPPFHFQEHVGQPVYMLFRAVKNQLEKGTH